MIYTITFNPSLDYFVHLPSDFKEGEIMRADESFIRVGGKGINISITLAMVNIHSRVLTFIGGSIGSFIEKEVSSIPNIEFLKVDIEKENRINIKISSGQESAINAKGPVISKAKQDELLGLLDGLASGDYVIISGSYSSGISSDLMYRIGALSQKVGAKLITDVPNLTFEDLKCIKPFLIKPNVEELGFIFNETISEDNYQEYVDKLLDAGVNNVLLSIGSPGSYFANKSAKYRSKGPKVDVVSTVGCGDSMLAYMISRLYIGDDFKTALAYGEAAGRVKASQKELVEPQEVESMLRRVTIERI